MQCHQSLTSFYVSKQDSTAFIRTHSQWNLKKNKTVNDLLLLLVVMLLFSQTYCEMTSEHAATLLGFYFTFQCPWKMNARSRWHSDLLSSLNSHGHSKLCGWIWYWQEDLVLICRRLERYFWWCGLNCFMFFFIVFWKRKKKKNTLKIRRAWHSDEHAFANI